MAGRYLAQKEFASSEAVGQTLNDGVNKIPSFRVCLIRETLAPGQATVIGGPRDVAKVMSGYLAGLDREVFAILLLDNKNKIIGLNTVSVGDLSSAIIHPREVYKPAILSGAASIIGCHNHPSGDPTPSANDVGVSKRLINAGEILGIDFLDHVVIGDGSHGPLFMSLKERGLI